MPAQTMTAFRIMIAGVIALIIVLFTKELRRITKREWTFTILGMIFGVIAHQLFLALGLQSITASKASLILALVPIATAVLEMIFLGEMLNKARITGFALDLFVRLLLKGSTV